MNIEEALFQIKQNIKMHKIDGTTSNQNEREKALLEHITNLQEKLNNQAEEINRLVKQREKFMKKYGYLQEEHKIPKKITMRADMVGDINNKIENLNINQIAIEDKINEIIDYLEVNNENKIYK